MFMSSRKVVSLFERKQAIDKQMAANKEVTDERSLKDTSSLIHSIRHALEWHSMQEELHRLHRELYLLEERFRSVVDKNADSIIIVDSQGVVCFANQATEALFNCPLDKILGQEFFGKFVVEKKACDIDTSIMSRSGTVGTSDMRVVQTWVDILPTEGEKAVAEMRVVETEWEGKIAFLILLRDISQRLRAEEALRQERDFSKTLVEASPAFFIAVSTEGKTLMMNQAVLNALGYTLEEVVDADYLSRFVHCSDRDRVFESFQQACALRTTQSGESRILTKDGRELLVEWHSRPVFKINGELNFIFAVGMDISDRKLAEEALRCSETKFREQAQRLELALHELKRTQAQLVQTEKMSSLGQMVAGVAHEINNPVNFIYGNLSHANQYTKDLLELVQLYQKNYPNPVLEIQECQENIDLPFLIEDLPKMLSSMELGADRIRQIVLSLRNFSRLDEAEKKPVNIHEGLDNTLLILHNRLKAKPGCPEIEIVKKYGNLPLIECYAGQLNQVFMNILSNAIDALEMGQRTRSGGPEKNSPIPILHDLKPEICIRTEAIDGNKVAIRIADNGMGMNEEVRHQLFDPFFTTKPVGKGTGLGLSISYQVVVERHGGELKCFSEPGKGAEFVIEIPIK